MINKIDKRCHDCRENTHHREYYMVHNTLWELACGKQLKSIQFLCIGCLEKRLKHTLNCSDFILCPINDPLDKFSKKSRRLRNRLKGYRKYRREELEYCKKYMKLYNDS